MKRVLNKFSLSRLKVVLALIIKISKNRKLQIYKNRQQLY